MTGSTASLAFGDTIFSISAQGQDERNLGRWMWMMLTGKNGLDTTIINCYWCLCHNSGQSGSVYAQHLVYMASHPDAFPVEITCTRDLFGHDRKELTAHLQVDVHKVLINGDFNAEYDDLEK